jgi:signal transduction histidine kinase
MNKVNSVVPLNRERRILLICGAVLLLAGVVYRFSSSIPSLFSGSDEMSFKQKELVRYREVLQEKSRLEATLISAERELARAEAGLLPQQTPTLAAADIQNMIDDVAEQKNIRIESMRVLKSKTTENGKYIAIPLEVIMTASIRQIEEVLFFIENSQRLLKITAIRIRLTNVRNPEKLYCSFTVEGLMKSGGI